MSYYDHRIDRNKFQQELLAKIANGAKLTELLGNQERGITTPLRLNGEAVGISKSTVNGLIRQRLLTYRIDDYPERVYSLTMKARRIVGRKG